MRRIVRWIGLVGRLSVGGGLILLFFTAYMLWGTGVYTKGAQREAARALAAKPVVSNDDLSGGKIPPARPASPAQLGDPLFEIKIPKIGLEKGVDQGSLRKGVGHFPTCGADDGTGECLDDTRYPGESGNVALSGHRTTYGAPFFRVDELSKGDTIDIVSGRVRYRYRMREQKIVDPVAGFATVEQHGRDELTLTTCHPRFSAAQRLVIHADYVGASLLAAPLGVAAGASANEPLPIVAPDVIFLAAIAVASALGSLAMSNRYRRFVTYLALGLAGSAVLWVGVFPRVLALLPTNY